MARIVTKQSIVTAIRNINEDTIIGIKYECLIGKRIYVYMYKVFNHISLSCSIHAVRRQLINLYASNEKRTKRKNEKSKEN